MARKGVNLLEGDDEEREGDSDGDSGDDGGSYERRRGGFVDVLMVILFVCVMLGGVAWAGYQFWWLPKVKKEAQLKRARMKQEQQRRMLLANRQGTRRVPERVSQTAGAAPPQRAMGATGRNIQPNRPTPPRSAEKKAMPRKSTPRSPAAKAPPATSAVMEKPAAPPKMKEKPRREPAMVIQIPEKKASVPKTGPARSILRKKQVAEKKPEAPKAKIQSAPGARKSTRGFYYSVQVASCRTERCADSFSKRLKSKGFSAFRVASTSRATTRSRATSTSRARRRSGQQITEVRLGSFSSLSKARALASRAKKNKIEARVYRSDKQWRVAAGRFRNLEDAALLLDRAEDAGFRGELASRLQNGRTSRPQSGKTRKLYRIRTGKFETLRKAMAFRKKIRLAGFSDAIVVRRRSRR